MLQLHMVTFTINIPQMLAYIPYMDPMGYTNTKPPFFVTRMGFPIIAASGRAPSAVAAVAAPAEDQRCAAWA